MTSLRNQRAKAEFYKQHQQEVEEQEQIRLAPIHRQAQKNAALQAELNEAELNLLLTQPSAELTSRCPKYVPNEFQTVEEVMEHIHRAYLDFKALMKERGVTVHDAAQAKFGRVFKLNGGNIDTRKPETFTAVFDAIDSVNGWTADEVTKATPNSPQPSEPETTADIESLNTYSNRADEKKAKKIVEKQFWKEASAPLFHQWIASLYEHWKFVPSEKQKEQAFNLITELNLSPTDRKTYDVLRKAAIAKGIFPPTLVTGDELLQRELEEFRVNNPNASEREERIWFARRAKELEVK